MLILCHMTLFFPVGLGILCPVLYIFYTWYLPFRTSLLLHSFQAAQFFCRHPSVQNTIFPNKVQWSVIFLLPGSSFLEPAPCFCPCFCPLFYLYQFFQIFLEHFPLFKSLFFSPTSPIYDSVCVCAWVCMCVCVRLCCGEFWKYVHLKKCLGPAQVRRSKYPLLFYFVGITKSTHTHTQKVKWFRRYFPVLPQ